MLKKILALAAAASLALTLSACGGTAVKLPELALEGDASSAVSGLESSGAESSAPAAAEADDSKFDDDLDGLCSYMEENLAVVQDGTENSFTQMSFGEIGAVGGYRYRFTYNRSTVQVEFYEFDLDALNEKGQACLDEARESGKITVLDNQVPVLLHPTERYMMIYTDLKTGEKGDAKSNAQRDRAEELFVKFKA